MTKQVLITGAADGLGWALAKAYADHGYHVHMLDRDEERLAQRKEELRENATTYAIDLLNDEQLNSFCVSFPKQVPKLDLLINNAGITHRSKANETQFSVFDNVMTLNWRVPVFLTRALLKSLEQAKGKIICLASMAAVMPVPGRAAYCASKSALSQHFETWRPELYQQSIKLLIIFPSFVSTSIEKNALGEDGNATKRPQSRIGQQITAKTMAQQIINADFSGKERLYSSQLPSRFGFWLWFLIPKLFQKISWRQFSGELD